jgi:hypothetical protein
MNKEDSHEISSELKYVESRYSFNLPELEFRSRRHGHPWVNFPGWQLLSAPAAPGWLELTHGEHIREIFRSVPFRTF